MGRLIGENSVIEVAEKCTFTDKNERKKYLDFVRYCVEQSKTAYDAEKVVEQLEDKIEISWERDYLGGKKDAFIEAIEIVRKGGVE
jgi:hypothetical protein